MNAGWFVAVAVLAVVSVLVVGLRMSRSGSRKKADNRRYAQVAEERRRERRELMDHLSSMIEADPGADESVHRHLAELEEEDRKDRDGLEFAGQGKRVQVSGYGNGSQERSASDDAGAHDVTAKWARRRASKEAKARAAREKKEAEALRKQEQDRAAREEKEAKARAAREKKEAEALRKQEQDQRKKEQKHQTQAAKQAATHAASRFHDQAHETVQQLADTQQQLLDEQHHEQRKDTHTSAEQASKTRSGFTRLRKRKNDTATVVQPPKDSSEEERRRYEYELHTAELSSAAKRAAAAAAQQAATARALFDPSDDTPETAPQDTREDEEADTSAEPTSYASMRVAAVVDYHSYGLPEDLPEPFLRG